MWKKGKKKKKREKVVKCNLAAHVHPHKSHEGLGASRSGSKVTEGLTACFSK